MSVRGLWSGDVDLNDGKLPKMYSEYTSRLSFIKGMGLSNQHSTEQVVKDLTVCIEEVSKDVTFIANSKCTISLCCVNDSGICSPPREKQ